MAINIYELSTPEELNTMLKDDDYIKEFCNRVIFDGMSKPKAWCMVFRVDSPMNANMQTKMYRWVKKPEVQKWLEKSNKSLEIDWIDKRVNALQHLYNMGTNSEANDKNKIDALDKFLGHLNREESKIRIDIGQPQVNIIQIVQDKLSQITSGATIQPDYIEAQIEDKS